MLRCVVWENYYSADRSDRFFTVNRQFFKRCNGKLHRKSLQDISQRTGFVFQEFWVKISNFTTKIVFSKHKPAFCVVAPNVEKLPPISEKPKFLVRYFGCGSLGRLPKSSCATSNSALSVSDLDTTHLINIFDYGDTTNLSSLQGVWSAI
jgi:hypothetical protein